MKRVTMAFLSVLLLLSSTGARAETPSEPIISALCAIVVDADTGRVLYEKNPNEQRAIASITKLMTALVAIRSTPDLSQEVTVKREYTLTEGSSIYLRVGETLTLEALLYGLMLESGNDAALAVAGFCAGDTDTFVGWMNDWTEELDMEDSHFSTPSGLKDEENYSTAADMAKLARVIIADETLAKIVSTKSATFGTRTFTNHNKLLWRYEGCLGMKTGYTDKAGRTLVSCAERGGQRLIVVTLKAPDDWKDHATLLDYGFEKMPRQMLALAGREVRSLAVTGSLVRLVGVTTTDDVYYPLLEGEKVTSKLSLPLQVTAPVCKGNIAGEMTFFLNDKEIGKTYLEYAASVASDIPRRMSLLERIQQLLQKPEEEGLLTAFFNPIKL